MVFSNYLKPKATTFLFLMYFAPGALFADAKSSRTNPPGLQCSSNPPDYAVNKPLSETVSPCRVRNIIHAGAKIRILKGALQQQTTITIRPLEVKELPALGGKGNVGMDMGK